MKFKRKLKIKTTSVVPGSSPGSFIYIGSKPSAFPFVHVLSYCEASYQESEKLSEQITPAFERATDHHVHWLNIEGISNTDWMRQVSQQYQLHAMLMEDVLNTGHRPKIDTFNDATLVIAKMLTLDVQDSSVQVEQISFVLIGNTLITFQEIAGDVFEPVRERIRKAVGKIRTRGADYLLFCLLDAIVDHYILIMEKIGVELDNLEDRILENPTDSDIHKIHHYKRQFSQIRKASLPLREVVNHILKDDSLILNESNEFYYRDLFDNILAVQESLDLYTETLNDLQGFCFSHISNKTNQIMKTLTVISAIFIPLTFIAGVYGMNFDIMPELRWEYGYFIVLGVMFFIAFVMLVVFWRKKWL